MELALNNFEVLDQSQMQEIDGDGVVGLFVSTVGLAWSIPVSCVNPVAGATLFIASVSGISYNLNQLR